jgi:uncharacterized protein
MLTASASSREKRQEKSEEEAPPPPPPSSKRVTPSKRGFSHLSPEQVREYARRGGKATHKKKKDGPPPYKFTSETAKEAGRKGGQTTAQKPGHMAEIGRQGGYAAVGRKRAPTKKKPKEDAEE